MSGSGPDLSNMDNHQEREYAASVAHRYPGVDAATIYNTEVTLNATIRAADTFQEMGKLYPHGGQNSIAVWQYGLCLQLFDVPEMARYLSLITAEDHESHYLQVVMKAVLLLIEPDLPRTHDYNEKLVAFLALAAGNNAMVKEYMRSNGVGAVLYIFERLLGSNEHFERLKGLLS